MEPLDLPPLEFLLLHFKDGGDKLLRLNGAEAGTKGGPYCRVRCTYQGQRVQYYAHRILWKMRNGDEPERIDHRNGNTRDNSPGNLRVADRSQNSGNQRSQEPLSGHKNVYRAASGSYFAMLSRDGVTYRSSCTSLEQAVLDAHQLRTEVFGEFARAV
jgi:hypothetical protein